MSNKPVKSRYNPLREIEARKQAIKKELEHIQEELEDSIDDVKEGVSGQLNPRNWIKKHPLKSAAVALVTGFLISRKRKSSPKESKAQPQKLSGMVVQELKKQAVKKGFEFLSSLIEKPRKTGNPSE